MSAPTAFTDLVGCRLPVQLAPMGGGVGTARLAAAVSEAGGLGMLSSAHFQPVDEQIGYVRDRTAAPIGVGFFAFDLPKRMAELEAAARAVRVIDLFWGDPDEAVIAAVHDAGALVVWQAGSRDEALAAADAGCDAVVAQGVEAGGHVRGTTPLLQLLEEVVPRVGVPVIAAGGIASAGAVDRAVAAGASAVRIGTRLLATHESAAHEDYLAALLAADGADTVLTTAFCEGWPDAPHRVLRRAVASAEAAPGGVVGTVAMPEGGWDVQRWSALPPSTFCSGEITAMAMYAGAGVGDITRIASVAEVLEELTRGL